MGLTLIGRNNPAQIGFARLVTDEVSFAYLTDVYVLKEYQGNGLGSWMMDCVNEELGTWPELRRLMLVSTLKDGQAFYARTLGMAPFNQGENGMVVLARGRVYNLTYEVD
jgi:hypothetical protein